MLHHFTNLLTFSRLSTSAVQDPGLLCLMVTFLLCTDIPEIVFMAALVGFHQILPTILRILLDPSSAKQVYSLIYHDSKTNIVWMIAPAVALSFYRSVRLITVETRLSKLERKQAAAAARLRRQRSNLGPQDTLSAEVATNRLSR